MGGEFFKRPHVSSGREEGFKNQVKSLREEPKSKSDRIPEPDVWLEGTGNA